MSKVFTIAEGLENLGAVKTGGQGSVYKGKRIGEIVTAVKLLPTPIFTEDDSNKHYLDFINEVKKLQCVNEEPNPNVVKILSYGISETGGFPYIEMEYIDGPDLSELLKPPHPSIFTIRETMKVAEHLSHALSHCHKMDVKHGDIKSNNIKFNKHTGNYVLIDFGLSILSDEERRTSLRNAGAIEFMAPEQNEGQMFFETDVYSFGIVLFELLAGRVPFPLNGNSETARNKVMMAHLETPPPDLLTIREEALPAEWTKEQRKSQMQVPEWLLSIIYKCLEKKPEDRFRNGTELLQAIHQHSTQYSASQNDAILIGANADEVEILQNKLAEKEAELERLRLMVTRQDEELRSVRTSSYATVATQSASGGVSRTAFRGLMIMMVLFAAVTVYSLFFNKRTAGMMMNDMTGTPSFTDSSVTANAAKESREKNKEAVKPRVEKSVAHANEQQKQKNEITKKKQTTDEEDNTDASEEMPVKPVAKRYADTLRKKSTAETKSVSSEEDADDAKKEDSKKGDNIKVKAKTDSTKSEK